LADQRNWNGVTIGPPMRQLLITAFKDAVNQIEADGVLMPLARWNESIFRFIFSRAIANLEPDVRQFFECSKIDLVLHRKSERAFVEFKFYAHLTKHDEWSGKKTGKKGYASPKNIREFEASVAKLRVRSQSNLEIPEPLKLLALFYADPVGTKGLAYDKCYGDGSDVDDRLNIHRLVSIGTFPLNGADCCARLFEVEPKPLLP
jgi:hypothetical protein